MGYGRPGANFYFQGALPLRQGSQWKRLPAGIACSEPGIVAMDIASIRSGIGKRLPTVFAFWQGIVDSVRRPGDGGLFPLIELAAE